MTLGHGLSGWRAGQKLLRKTVHCDLVFWVLQLLRQFDRANDNHRVES
jgi:hypothetical protein